MSELPTGWVEERLSEVCELITDGTHHSPSNGAVGEFKYVTAKNIRKHGLDLTNITFVDAATHREIYKRCPVKLGDVLYIKDGATTGLAIVNPLEEEFSMLSSVALLRPADTLLNAQFLRQQLNSRSLRERMTGDMTGSAIRRLTLTTIGKQEVAVPPLAEQKRIVAKLDALNAKSASARTELARIEALVSRYKQAVLGKAFSGVDAERIALLDLTEFVTSGSRGWAKFYSDEGPLFIRIGNTVRGTIVANLDDIQRVTPPEGAEGVRTRVLPNDIVVTITADLGRVALIDDKIGEAYVNQHLALVRLSNPDSAAFFAWYFVSDEGQAQLHRNNRGATRSGLGLDDIRQVEVPNPPLEEQREIVRHIESAFAKIDRLAKEAMRALELVGRLDEAILAKAIRGELVPQDENDEPAEKLLERIRAERQAAPKVKKRIAKRTSAMLTAKDFLKAKLPNWPHDGISFQELRSEFSGSYDNLKDAVFAMLSDENAPLRQVFDEQRSTMTLRKRGQ